MKATFKVAFSLARLLLGLIEAGLVVNIPLLLLHLACSLGINPFVP